MFKLFALLVIFFNALPGFAYLTVSRPYTSYTGNYLPYRTGSYNNSAQFYNNRNYSGRYHSYNQPYGRRGIGGGYGIPPRNLSALERYALKKNYARENDLQRLERLESLAFGAVQQGDIVTRYSKVEDAILSRPQSTYKRSVLGSIADYFSGQPTGYTPSITNTGSSFFVNPYNPGYSTSAAEQYSNGIFGGGWGSMNQNFTSGSNVKILD